MYNLKFFKNLKYFVKLFSELGAHRFLDFYQEIGFAIIYVFMGVFVLKPEYKVYLFK